MRAVWPAAVTPAIARESITRGTSRGTSAARAGFSNARAAPSAAIVNSIPSRWSQPPRVPTASTAVAPEGGCVSLRKPRSAPGWPGRFRGNGGVSPAGSHQPVEFARVLAGDLADNVGRQVAELLLDVLRRLRPHPVGVRVVRRPQER